MTETKPFYAVPFSMLHSWDDVLSFAAGLRQDIDANRWQMGDLIHWACPRRKAGRPDQADERWNISVLAHAIGEDRSMLSSLAANAEFWIPPIRDEIPKSVSWKVLSRARVATGWKPGKEYNYGQLNMMRLEAMDYIIQAADGDLPRPGITAETYALRAQRAAEGAMKGKLSDKISKMFFTIAVVAAAILEEIKND